MKKLTFIIILIASFIVVSCRVKNSCEINHTGSIAVINHYGETVELRINNEKIGEIENGNVMKSDRLVGKYDINVVKFPNVWDTTVNVVECEIVEYTISK
jgi:uncharacterized protein YcfL